MFSDYFNAKQGGTQATTEPQAQEQSMVSPEQAASMAADTSYQDAPVPYEAEKEETGVTTSEYEDYRFQPDATLEKPAFENVLEWAENIKNANVTDMVADAAIGLWGWMKGSKANLENVTDKGNDLAKSNPLALSGTPMASGMTNAPAPTVTPEQKKVEETYKEATGKLNEETLKPLAMTAATVASAGTIAGALGAVSLGAGATTLLEASTLLGVPHMLADTLGSMKKDGIEGAKKTAMNFLPLYGAYQQASSPGYAKYAKEHPGQALWSVGLNAAASVAPITVPMVRAGSFIKSRVNIPDTHPASMLTDIIYDIRKNKNFEALYENKEVIAKLVEDTKKAVEPNKLAKVESIAKAFNAHNEATSGSLQADFANGGRKIEIGESSLTEPVRIADIMATASSLTPVRVGHMTISRKSVGGYFETKGEGIRIRDHGEFGVIAHEIGHYVDKVLEIVGHDKELIENARDVWGDGIYKPNELRGEGIAEFTREYLLNPAEASKNFPGYYESFVSSLSRNTEVATKMGVLGEQMRMWYKQDPAARARGAMSFYADRPQPKLKDSLKKLKLKSEIELVDKYAYFNSIVKTIEKDAGIKLSYDENPYYQALALADLTSAAGELMTNKTATPQLMSALRERFSKQALPEDVLYGDILTPIADVTLNTKHAAFLKLTNCKDMHEALGTYLTARHLPEVHMEMQKRFVEELFAKMEKLQEQLSKAADNSIEQVNLEAEFHRARIKMQRAIKGDFGYKMSMSLDEAKRMVELAPPEIRQAAQAWDKYMSNFRGLAEYYGLMSAKDKAHLEETYPNYSPLLRVMERDNVPMGAESSFVSSGDSFANVSQLYKALSEKGSGRDVKDPVEALHLMTQHLLEKGEKNLTAQKLVALDGKVEGMSNYFIKASNKEVPNAADMTFSVYEKGKQTIWQATDKMLYDAITYTDGATATNILEQSLNMGASLLRVGATSSPGFILRQLVKDSLMMGLTHESKRVFIPIIDSLYGLYLRNDKALMAHFEAQGVPYKTQNKSLRGINKAIKEKIGMKAYEPSSKLGKIAMWGAEKLGVSYKMLADIGKKVEEAPRLVEMKRLMDEGMSPAEAAFFAGDGTVNFSRSGVTAQQWNRRTVFVNARIQGTNKVWRSFRDNPKRTAARLVTQGMIPTLVLWSLNHNEEWYRKLAPDIKNANWVFRVNGQTVRIPKPDSFGVMFSGVERALDYCVDNDTEVPPAYAQYLGSEFGLSVLPTAIIPLMTYQTNYDLFTQQNIVRGSVANHSSGQQYDSYTSEVSKKIGAVTGLSPKKLDVAIGTATGTLGKEALSGIDLLVGAKANKPESERSHLPAIGGFLVDEHKRPAPVAKFYKDYRALVEQKADTGNVPDNYGNYTSIARQMTRLNGNIRNIETDQKRNPAQKKRDADVVRVKILKLAQTTNRKYGKYMY